MADDICELTEADFARAMPRKQRERIMRGRLEPVTDIVVLQCTGWPGFPTSVY